MIVWCYLSWNWFYGDWYVDCGCGLWRCRCKRQHDSGNLMMLDKVFVKESTNGSWKIWSIENGYSYDLLIIATEEPVEISKYCSIYMHVCGQSQFLEEQSEVMFGVKWHSDVIRSEMWRQKKYDDVNTEAQTRFTPSTIHNDRSQSVEDWWGYLTVPADSWQQQLKKIL